MARRRDLIKIKQILNQIKTNLRHFLNAAMFSADLPSIAAIKKLFCHLWYFSFRANRKIIACDARGEISNKRATQSLSERSIVKFSRGYYMKHVYAPLHTYISKITYPCTVFFYMWISVAKQAILLLLSILFDSPSYTVFSYPYILMCPWVQQMNGFYSGMALNKNPTNN